MAAPLQVSADRKPALTVNEFARATSTSPVTVRQLIAKNVIPSFNLGGSRRIPAEVLEAIQRGEPVEPVESDFDAEIRRLVDLAPKLTPAQRDAIAAIFAEQPVGGVAS